MNKTATMLLLGLGALVVCGGAALVLLRDPAPPSGPSATSAVVDLGGPGRPVPGLEYAPAGTLPSELVEYLAKFSVSFKRAKLEQPDNRVIQSGLNLPWLKEGNPVAESLGLRPTDRVLAVHGQPEGVPLVLGEETIDMVLDERWFAVLVERQGRRLVLSCTLP